MFLMSYGVVAAWLLMLVLYKTHAEVSTLHVDMSCVGRAAKAAATGLFDAEIIPVTTTLEDASGQTKTVTVSAERALLSVVSGQTKTVTVSAERALLT